MAVVILMLDNDADDDDIDGYVRTHSGACVQKNASQG